MSTNHFSTNLLEAPWWVQHQYMMEASSLKASSSSTPNNNNNSLVYPQVNASNTTMFGFNLNHEDAYDDVDDDDAELDELDNTQKVHGGEEFDDDDEEEEEQGGGKYSEEEEVVIHKEALFEKPLTPSDVGKLNRLVIPKQHAEKHFPMSTTTNNDSVEKGFLLSFEDESGKPWRFRYSYWNSSQSYVLTKGWSRFVKEKSLHAGDVVLFLRHCRDTHRFFIGWRRKDDTSAPAAVGGVSHPPTAGGGGGGGGGGGWTTPVFYSGNNYPYQASSHGSHLPYQPDYLHAAGSLSSVIVEKQKTGGSSSGGNSKRLRLFGVNMEFHEADHHHHECIVASSELSTPEAASSSSSSTMSIVHHQILPPHHHHHHHHHHQQQQLQPQYHHSK